MRIALIILFTQCAFVWGQKMTGFWQGMLFDPQQEQELIPVYLDIYVTNGMVDGKMRIEHNDGVSIFPVFGTFSEQELKLTTLKATWHYKPEYALTPNTYNLTYNPKNGYLEGNSDKDQFRFIAYQSKGVIEKSKTAYLPSEWLVRFKQELEDGISAPMIRKQELMQFKFQPVYFDYDQAEIRVEYQNYLLELIRMVKSHSDLRIQITGHTDADGSDAYNLELSKRRSDALIEFFVQNGLPKDRVDMQFKGENEPADDNSTEEGKQHNRRVDFNFI
jgi:OOP family OmpA-OmpF porin